MRIGILHPGPFRGGAPAVTAGQVRKKQCGKAGRSPRRGLGHTPGWVTSWLRHPGQLREPRGPPRQPLAAPPCDARGGGAPHHVGSCGRVPLPCATACATPAGPLEVSSSWVRDTRAQIRPGTREAERGELRSRGAKGHGARGRRPRPPSALPPRRSLLGAICFRLLCGELLASLSPE